MSSLDELIHYCNEPDPVGALMLTGEWGCGKTYTIERELTEALKDTHIIVRISLFGMSDVKTLRNTVRNRWFEVCMPFLGALQKAKDRGLFTAISRMLTGVNPVAGGTAGIVVSADMRDFIPIKPEIEDFKTQVKKRVVLVYDDLERSKMGLTEAEAVMDIISARGEQSARAAALTMEGSLHKRIDRVKQKLTTLAAHLAAWADYPEEDIPQVEEKLQLEQKLKLKKCLETKEE